MKFVTRVKLLAYLANPMKRSSLLMVVGLIATTAVAACRLSSTTVALKP